ncbi:MAG: hypothetical protein K6F94_08985 [Bacteroidaceae bacterium]|nr:hypothetical protein [Bacteroidaceae bacterium]
MTKKKQEAKATEQEQAQLKQQIEQELQQQGMQMVDVSRERMLEGIREAVKQMRKMMRDAKAKYGIRYNEKNEYEEFCRRFGWDDAEKILQEFDLIRAKQSQQPSVIRNVIKQLGENAVRYCYVQWLKEQKEKSEIQNTAKI